MKALALILFLAVLTGCSARSVMQVEVSVTPTWEVTVDQFWQHFVKLRDMDDGDVQIPDFGTTLDTLITASMSELTGYIDEVSKGQLSSDRELQRLVIRLKGDMLNAKEHGVQSMSQQVKSMGRQDFHIVQMNIRAFTAALRVLLDRDIQDIRKYLSEHQISQNPDTVEPFVQQTADTTSHWQAGGLGQQHQQNQDEDLSQQRRNQHEVLDQQRQNQDEVLDQQRRNQDEDLGQQRRNQDGSLGQQRRNQAGHPDQIWDRGQERERQGTVLVSTIE